MSVTFSFQPKIKSKSQKRKTRKKSMDWFGKSSKVEGKNEMESLGIRFDPTIFHPDRNEYELCIHLSGCPKDLIKLTYDKPSGKLKLQGKKQKKEFVHQFPVPADCLAIGIYGRFRGDVLHVIMPRLLSEDASSKQEDDQTVSSDPEATEQVGQDRENLPSTEGGGKDRDEVPARARSVPSPSEQETTEKLRQRDNELFPEISARRPLSSSVKELRENYQKNISKIAAPPPPPPPTPRGLDTAPWNRKTNKIGSKKEEEENREPLSDQRKVEQGDVEPEKSIVKSQKNESKSGQEVAKNGIIVTESKDKEKSEEKKPSADGKETLGLVAKVKETGKAAVAVAMKEENRPVVMIGAAVLALLVIGASLRSSSKKTKN